MTIPIHLLVQYFRVKQAVSTSYRQTEIQQTLLKNIENPHITKIHLFVEGDDLDLSFLHTKAKVVIIPSEERLTYQQAFKYYNSNIPNTICILSNADIYFDDSLKYLQHIKWSLNVFVCPTRYESEDDTKPNILYGLGTDLSKESKWLESDTESVYSQDCWIWCNSSINATDCDFGIGVVGCDNLIARRIYDSGYTLVKCSHYICVNHLDRLSKKLHTDIKGGQSSVREKRLGSYSDYLFLGGKSDIFPDKYSERIYNIRRGLDFWNYRVLDVHHDSYLQPLLPLLKPCQLVVTSCMDGHDATKLALGNKSYWCPSNNDKRPSILIRFNHAVRLACMDIQGIPAVSSLVGFPKKLQISFSENGHSFVKVQSFDAISINNYEHTARIYFKEIIASCIRIRIIDHEGVVGMRMEVYFIASSFINSIDKSMMRFKEFVFASQCAELHRKYLTVGGLYKTIIPDMYNKHPAPWRRHLDANAYSSFFSWNTLNRDDFWKKYTEAFFCEEVFLKSNIYGKPIRKGICIVTCVMNRTQNIEKYLDSWLQKEVNQIVIVDWSSDESFYDTIQNKNDSRLVYVRVEGETFFSRTYAQNLGIKFSEYDQVLKLDSDISLKPRFFEFNRLHQGEFICGNFMVGRNDNEKYTHGNVFFYLNDCFKINGYNEIITSYGHDDSDFSLRLQLLAGLRETMLDLDFLYHNPHSELMRVTNLNKVSSSKIETEKNRMCIEKVPLWNRAFSQQEFEIVQVSSSYFKCKRLTKVHYSIPKDVEYSVNEDINKFTSRQRPQSQCG